MPDDLAAPVAELERRLRLWLADAQPEPQTRRRLVRNNTLCGVLEQMKELNLCGLGAQEASGEGDGE